VTMVDCCAVASKPPTFRCCQGSFGAETPRLPALVLRHYSIVWRRYSPRLHIVNKKNVLGLRVFLDDRFDSLTYEDCHWNQLAFVNRFQLRKIGEVYIEVDLLPLRRHVRRLTRILPGGQTFCDNILADDQSNSSNSNLPLIGSRAISSDIAGRIDSNLTRSGSKLWNSIA